MVMMILLQIFLCIVNRMLMTMFRKNDFLSSCFVVRHVLLLLLLPLLLDLHGPMFTCAGGRT